MGTIYAKNSPVSGEICIMMNDQRVGERKIDDRHRERVGFADPSMREIEFLGLGADRRRNEIFGMVKLESGISLCATHGR
jgi:hypothetical protein